MGKLWISHWPTPFKSLCRCQHAASVLLCSSILCRACQSCAYCTSAGVRSRCWGHFHGSSTWAQAHLAGRTSGAAGVTVPGVYQEPVGAVLIFASVSSTRSEICKLQQLLPLSVPCSQQHLHGRALGGGEWVKCTVPGERKGAKQQVLSRAS